MLLKRLVSDLCVPAFALTDANVYGYEIFLTYKFGSPNFAYESAEIAVPELIRIGVTADDIRDLIDAAPRVRVCREPKPNRHAQAQPVANGATSVRVRELPNVRGSRSIGEREKRILVRMLTERPDSQSSHSLVTSTVTPLVAPPLPPECGQLLLLSWFICTRPRCYTSPPGRRLHLPDLRQKWTCDIDITQMHRVCYAPSCIATRYCANKKQLSFDTTPP